ncbi:MAG: hypothetical protein U5K72_15770 [Balneolaceae bacterium]|nr:hypothetical protein [Balneolaceae bacterium]
MKILIPQHVRTSGKANPYLFLLMRELHKLNKITEIQHGYGWLYEPGLWDIIHLHWPEYLVKSQLTDMTRIDLLQEKHFKKVTDSIEQKKSQGAKIVLTVHNEKPHEDKGGIFDSFYDQIYDLADGFIHLGTFSEKKLHEVYPKAKEKSHFVIPHGDYNYFPSDMKRSECRQKLNIDEDQKLLLAFGAIRSKEELELGINAFNNSSVENSIFLVAGSLPHPYRSELDHYITRKKLYTNVLNKRIKVHEKVVAPEEVQIYLKATDLLFLPRLDTLNSGNIALGFTFGKVVTGPGYGVIGEILNETGNPVFDPANLESVSEGIEKGFELSEEGHGIKNKEYANHQMNWKNIAQKTVQSYKSL